MLGMLAAFAVFACELPEAASWPTAAAALVGAVAQAQREIQRPALDLVIPHNGAATVDGAPVDQLHVDWRGPLAFLQWRDGAGRRHRRQGWPDTLDRSARRELRLAMAARAPAHSPRSVAP